MCFSCGACCATDPNSSNYYAADFNLGPEALEAMQNASRCLQIKTELGAHEYYTSRLKELLESLRWNEEELFSLSRKGSGDDFLKALCYQAIDKRSAEVLGGIRLDVLLKCRAELSVMEKRVEWLESVIVLYPKKEPTECPNDLFIEHFVPKEVREACRKEKMDFSDLQSKESLLYWLKTKDDRWTSEEIQPLLDLDGGALGAILMTNAFAREDWEVLQCLPREFSQHILEMAGSNLKLAKEGLWLIDNQLTQRGANPEDIDPSDL